MTPRRAAVLAMHLPAGAQVWISCGYDNAWTLCGHLTASLFDASQIANWQRAGGDKGSRPKPIRRPSEALQETAKQDRMAERARAHMERQQSTPPPRARDARGRFVKEA